MGIISVITFVHICIGQKCPETLRKISTCIESNKAIVFSGLDYFQIWFLLMTRNYKKLAANFVELGEARSREEIVKFLKSRTQKCPALPA